MFSAILLAISVVALASWGLLLRAVVGRCGWAAGFAAGADAASMDAMTISGVDYRALVQLHELTPDLSSQRGTLGLVSGVFQNLYSRDLEPLATGRISFLADWAENERALCARYAAVQVRSPVAVEYALAASMRSC